MSNFKQTPTDELVAKISSYEASIKALQGLNIPIVPEMSETLSAMQTELASREGEVIAAKLKDGIAAYVKKALAGVVLKGASFIGVAITPQEDGSLEIEVAATKKSAPRAASSAGAGTGTSRVAKSDREYTVSAPGIETKTFGSAAAALKYLQDSKVCPPDYGSSDSAVRALQRLTKTNTSIVLTVADAAPEVAAPAEAAAPVAEVAAPVMEVAEPTADEPVFGAE